MSTEQEITPTKMILSVLQRTNDNVLDLVRKTERLETEMKQAGKNIDILSVKTEKLSSESRKIVEILGKKMDPDRCIYLHNELMKQNELVKQNNADKCMIAHEEMKKKIYQDMKDSATGWGKKMLIVLKVVAWTSMAFGGSALGASMLGMFK